MNHKISNVDGNLDFLNNWIKGKNFVLCAILTGSRVASNSGSDFLSDYDIELFVSDIEIFKGNDKWLEEFAPIMVKWPLTPRATFNPKWITRLVLFQSGIRIDFQISTPEHFDPENYDNGYQVLIDKIGLTGKIPLPTFKKFNVTKPSKEEYSNLVNEFWWEITYVAKYIGRELGYNYPDKTDLAVVIYCKSIHNKDH